jgi:hypothetical protein
MISVCRTVKVFLLRDPRPWRDEICESRSADGRTFFFRDDRMRRRCARAKTISGSLHRADSLRRGLHTWHATASLPRIPARSTRTVDSFVGRMGTMKRWLALPLLLSGCAELIGPTIADAARARASADLSCPNDRISTYPTTEGQVVARGCGLWTQYDCSYSNGTPSCQPRLPGQVMSDSRAPARSR